MEFKEGTKQSWKNSTRIFCIVSFILLASFDSAWSQDWTMYFRVAVFDSDPACSRITTHYASLSGSVTAVAIEDSNGIWTAVASGNFDSFPSTAIFIDGQGHCYKDEEGLDKYIIMDTGFDPNQITNIYACQSFSWYEQESFGFTHGISVTLDYILGPPTLGTLSVISEASCSGNATVSVPYAGCGLVYWNYFNTALGYDVAIPGKVGTSISLNSADLGNQYGAIVIQAVEPNVPYRTSNRETIRIYVPAPTAGVFKKDQSCYYKPDGGIDVIPHATDAVATQFDINIYSSTDPIVPIRSKLLAGDGTLNSFTGLLPGHYIIKVNNYFSNANYGICTAIYEVDINPAPEIVITLSPVNAPCAGGYGSIQADVHGGLGALTYSWSNGATVEDLPNVLAGNYLLTVSDVSHNCSKAVATDVSQPTPITVSLTPQLTYRGYALSCFNEDDGIVNASASGGTGALNYVWSTGEAGSTAHALTTGVDYTVIVTDQNSCQITSTPVNLTNPPAINFSVNEINAITCFGGHDARLEVANVTNAEGSVAYSWSVNASEQTSFISGLSAGTGSVTVKDQLNCSVTRSYSIANPPAFTAAIAPLSDFNGSRIQCNGDNNGRIGALLYNDHSAITTGEYFTWYKDGNYFDEGTFVNSLDNLDAGLYKVKIQYRSQCDAEFEFNLTEPTQVTSSISVTSNYNGYSISCHGESDAALAVAGAGGTGALSYTWNTGTAGTILINRSAGDYSVVTKDINNCQSLSSITVVDPPPVQAQIASISNFSGFGVSCFGVSDGSLSINASGGTGVFSYLWQDGATASSRTALPTGTYHITASDNNGCSSDIDQIISTPTKVVLSLAAKTNISCYDATDGIIILGASGGAGLFEYSINNGLNWQSQSTFSSLSAANFSFLARDANLCSVSQSATLTEPTALQVSFNNVVPAFCATPVGAATASVLGGVASYKYVWKNSSDNTVSTQSTMTDASAGIYTLTIEDANHCMLKDQIPITSTDGAKTSWTSEAAKCFDSADGKATLTIISGDGPFLLAWPDGQTTLQGMNLKKGNYLVEVTDSHDCTVIETITVDAPDPISLAVATMKMPSCFGVSDGEITLAASGGAGTYTYAWNGNTASSQSQLAAGSYEVNVTDMNQCAMKQTVELTQPQDITIQIIKSILPTCTNGCDGVLEVAASGGNGGYQYQWGSRSSTSEITNVCSGDYAVKISDSKGCSKNMTVVLANTPAPTLDLGGGVTLCVGQTYSLDAGNNWTSYSWKSSTGLLSNQQRVVIKDPGQYWLEALTDKGCVAKDTFLLETSLDLLKASFLLPHEAEVGDTVVFIDVSWPLPETITWTFPTAMQKVYDMNEIVLGQFDKGGTYDIGLRANLGECRDYISKSITILKATETELPGGRLGYEEYVKDFTLYPNPTDGKFEVGVELIEEASITISIWNSTTGVMMKRVSLDGKSKYKAEFDLRPLGFGTYAIRLDHKKGKEYLRFVVH